MKILLACSAGMSTSILEKNVQDYAKEKKMDVEVRAVPTQEAKRILDQYDVILLGPQVAYELSAFKKVAGEKPIGVIPGMVYAMGKGDQIVEIAQSLINGKK